jgi:hypothetical protein
MYIVRVTAPCIDLGRLRRCAVVSIEDGARHRLRRDDAPAGLLPRPDTAILDLGPDQRRREQHRDGEQPAQNDPLRVHAAISATCSASQQRATNADAIRTEDGRRRFAATRLGRLGLASYAPRRRRACASRHFGPGPRM